MQTLFHKRVLLVILALASLAVTTACIYPEGGGWGHRGGGYRDHGQRHEYRHY